MAKSFMQKSPKSRVYKYPCVCLEDLVKDGFITKAVQYNLSNTNLVSFGDAYATLVRSQQFSEIADDVANETFDVEKFHKAYGETTLIDLGS